MAAVLLAGGCGGGGGAPDGDTIGDGDLDAEPDRVEAEPEPEVTCEPRSWTCLDPYRKAYCNLEGNAWSSIVDCGDGNVCTDDLCLVQKGGCYSVANSSTCDDGNPCTVDDICMGGACQGGQVRDCDDGNPCTSQGCDRSSGCVYQPVAALCEDGLAATDADRCDNGVCIDTTPAPCPGRPEMAQLPGGICVDRFEAVLAGQADCGGAYYGQRGDDYPDGFSDCVGYEGTVAEWCRDIADQTTPVYACVAPGELPSAWVSWYQAAMACRNSGKRLCTAGELQLACEGGEGWRYPYGAAFDPQVCNGPDYCDGISCRNDRRPAGGQGRCATAAGVYDLSGNLREWTGDITGPTDNEALTAGGYFGDQPDNLACDRPYSYVRLFNNATIGVRCCLDQRRRSGDR